MNYTAKITGMGSRSTVPDNAGAVDAEISCDGQVVGHVTLVPDSYNGLLSTWGNPDNWRDLQLDQHLDDTMGQADPYDQIAEIVEAVRHEYETEPDPAPRCTWTITISVDAALVSDGFDVANQVTGHDMGGELSTLGRIVDRVRPDQCQVRIEKAPTAAEMKLAQEWGDRNL